jgi:hypothetical protein
VLTTMAVIGSLGLMVGGIRMFVNLLLLAPNEDVLNKKNILDIEIPEPKKDNQQGIFARQKLLINIIIFSGTTLILVSIGLFPNNLVFLINQLSGMFEQIGR